MRMKKSEQEAKTQELWAKLKSNPVSYVTDTDEAFQQLRCTSYPGFQRFPRNRITEDHHKLFSEALQHTKDTFLQQTLTIEGRRYVLIGTF